MFLIHNLCDHINSERKEYESNITLSEMGEQASKVYELF